MTQRRNWTNALIVTGANGTAPEPLEVAVASGRIVVPGRDLGRPGDEIIDCDGRLVTPAFIDCHIHLVHGGDRARELTRMPPVQKLREAKLPIALATDCNPGTSPISSLLLTMNMAAVLFRMTVRECFEGVTVNAARALGLGDVTGQIAPGFSADFAVWNAQSVAQLVNRVGVNPLHSRIFKGTIYNG